MSYQLPVDVIIAVMYGLSERVVLRARVPALPGAGTQQEMASIVVDAHGLQGCVIRESRTGATLCEHEEAMHLLRRCGVLTCGHRTAASGWAEPQRCAPPARLYLAGGAGTLSATGCGPHGGKTAPVLA